MEMVARETASPLIVQSGITHGLVQQIVTWNVGVYELRMVVCP